MAAQASHLLLEPAPQARAPGIACRPLRPGDGPAAVELLSRGFPSRTAGYWRRALDRLASHAGRIGMDRFGLLLESGGVPVGVLLLIYSDDPARAGQETRCNVSSWYVEPRFQSYAPLLLTRAARDKAVTFFNISPAVHVRPIIEAQGFRRYGSGRFWCCPALGPRRAGVRVTRLDPASEGWAEAGGIGDRRDRDLIAAQVSYGCIALAVATPGGSLPFVLLPRMTKNVVPSAQLVFCRTLEDFVRFSGPIGRHLAARGMPVVSIDADGAVPGLVGRFAADDCPKYSRGPVTPRVGDMTDTELVMFGP